MNARSGIISSVRWTTLGTAGKVILQFMQVLVLSRMLAPGDFGAVALVTSILTVVQIFSDAGVSNAVIHHQDISDADLSSLYWLNVFCSALVAVALVAVAPLLGKVFGQPDLSVLLVMAAMAVIIISLGQQLRLQAQKRLDFRGLATVDLISATVGFTCALLMAHSGRGAESLVAGTLANAISGTLLSWSMLANGWRPHMKVSYSDVRPYLGFGSYMIGNNLANAINNQVDVFLGSRLLGAGAVGLYSVPKELTLRIAGLINPIVTQVAFPVMAKLQDDPSRMRDMYLGIMRATASINFPIYIFLGVFAGESVGVLFGPKWQDAVPLLRILVVWAILRSTVNPIGSLLMARGRADLSFNWNLVMLAIWPVAIWLGSGWGVYGMAAAMSVVMAVMYWPNWRYMVWPLCGAGFWIYTRQLVSPFAISAMSAATAWLITVQISHGLLRLVCAAAVFSMIYVGLSYRFNRQFVRQLIALKTRGS